MAELYYSKFYLTKQYIKAFDVAQWYITSVYMKSWIYSLTLHPQPKKKLLSQLIYLYMHTWFYMYIHIYKYAYGYMYKYV